MDRRNFCRVAALALGAISLNPIEALAAPVGGLRRARVTVLRRECFVDLQNAYLDDPETGRCRCFEPGQSFDTDGRCPDGFCPLAWRAIEACLAAGSACATDTPPGNEPFVAACPDGTRPVIFRIDPA